MTTTNDACDVLDGTQIKSLRFSPGDTVVLMHPGVLSNNQREQIKAYVMRECPAAGGCFILDGGMSVAILAADNVKATLEVLRGPV